MSPNANTELLSDSHSKAIEYRVMHVTLDRIRIKIPQRLKTLGYESRLKKLVESFDFVTHVRINSTAESMIVNYIENTISATALQQKLATAIEQANDLGVPNSVAVANSSQMELANTQPDTTQGKQQEHAKYLLVSLTPYEQKQVQEIQKWESKEPDLLSNLAGKLFSPINQILDVIIPAAVLEAGVKAAETMNFERQKDWEKIKQIAQLEDDCNLKQAKLEFCDRLVDKLESEAVTIAGIEGGIAGIFEWAGEIIDIPLSIGLSLQTIHRIGLCYGYSLEAETEKRFAWAILGIGTANTTEERKKARHWSSNL